VLKFDLDFPSEIQINKDKTLGALCEKTNVLLREVLDPEMVGQIPDALRRSGRVK